MVSLQSKPTVLRPILQTGGKTRLCIVCYIKLSILVIDSTVIPVFNESLSNDNWRSKPNSILSKVETDYNGTGFNIKSSTFVDMVKEGIIDPTKVTRTALENAVSVAGTMLITECTIVDKPSDKETAADPMAMMGM